MQGELYYHSYRMAVYLWMTVFILTTLVWGADLVILLRDILKYKSRTALLSLISMTGVMMILFAEAARVVSFISNLGDREAIVFCFLLTLGSILVVYGTLELAATLTHKGSELLLRPLNLALAIIISTIMIFGVLRRFPTIMAISETLMVMGLWWTGITVLFHRRNIQNQRSRKHMTLGALVLIFLMPFELIRLYIWSRSSDPFGVSQPSFVLLLLMLLLNSAAFFVGLKRLIINGTATDIDSEAILEYHITAREIEIIRLIRMGWSNDEIAIRLFVSPSTVKNHLYHMFQKTGSRNRVELLNAVISQPDSDALS